MLVVGLAALLLPLPHAALRLIGFILVVLVEPSWSIGRSSNRGDGRAFDLGVGLMRVGPDHPTRAAAPAPTQAWLDPAAPCIASARPSRRGAAGTRDLT